MSDRWECENCGWTCPPNPAITVEEAECDNCGDEMMPVSDEPSDAWDRFEATVEAVRQSGETDFS